MTAGPGVTGAFGAADGAGLGVVAGIALGTAAGALAVGSLAGAGSGLAVVGGPAELEGSALATVEVALEGAEPPTSAGTGAA